MRLVITSGESPQRARSSATSNSAERQTAAPAAAATGGGETMEIDAATRRNLELVQTMSGGREDRYCLLSTARLPVRAGVCYGYGWPRR